MTMLWMESFDSSQPHLRSTRDVADEVLVLLNYLSGERVCELRAQKQREERGSSAVEPWEACEGGIPSL